MFVYLLVLASVLGLPASGLAQFVDKGDYVQVKKGTTLCSNVKMEQAKGAFDPGKVFWRVTSDVRSNGTQALSAIEYETMYDRKSGDTTIQERRYDDDYATLFKRDPEHKGMLLMISPQNGTVQAVVEVCRKGKKQGADSASAK
jgi:hypothetical protein